MCNKTMFLILLVLSILIISTAPLGAQPAVVSAAVERSAYNVGELVDVNISVVNNPGLHGLYFDLTYDPSVLEIDSITESPLFRQIPRDNELLYAEDDSGVIVSYTLQGTNQETTVTGSLMRLQFRVKNQGTTGQSYGFTFSACGIVKGDGTDLTGVSWEDSSTFTINNPYEGSFIMIKKPYQYEVFYKDEMPVSLICSTGDFKVIVANPNAGDFETDAMAVTNGRIIDYQVPLNYGFNMVRASLYDSSDNLLAYDTVKVYRSEDDKFIKITGPRDHSLLNTDMVTVTVHSPYEQIEVNGLKPQYYGELVGDDNYVKVYTINLWLKQGFNTVTAIARSPEGAIYKDSITVYYQKDEGIFNFILPRQGENFKPGDTTSLFIKGEIDSPYKTTDDQATGRIIYNTVSLDVIYSPYGNTEDAIYLVRDKAALISESDYSYREARSKYVFTSNFDIPLSGLDNGEIEIIAYKNREGSSSDGVIHRVVYIDNNRLWIDLVQPNVYTHDLLDNLVKIKNFNEARDMTGDGNITVANDGGIVLKSTDKAVEDTGLDNVVDIIEQSDGTLFSLVNDTAKGSLTLYKKEMTGSSWTQVVSGAGLYGYQLCDSDVGIFIGASGLFNSGTSGLYLYRDGLLLNVELGSESLPNVQFVYNNNNKIYVYGNYYQYLYSFQTNSLEEMTGKFRVNALNKVTFTNSTNIKEFIVSSDGTTAIIRDDNNQISLFTKKDGGFEKVQLPEMDNDEGVSVGRHIVYGEYESGDYNVYLIIKDPGLAEVIMENKENQRYYRNSMGMDKLFPGSGDNPPAILGVSFSDNKFNFLFKNNSHYILNKGQIFFDTYYPGETNTLPEQDNDVAAGNFKMFTTGNNSYFTGYGDELDDPSLFHFYDQYKTSGTAQFNYVNDDIEGLTGFEFEVDPLWIKKGNDYDLIDFGFALCQKTGVQTDPGDAVLFDLPVGSLKEYLDPDNDKENPYFTVTNSFKTSHDKQIIHVDFKELWKDKNYIRFTTGLRSYGNGSPALYDVKVYKKIKAKICSEPDKDIILPLQGYIYDRTVNEVFIQGQTVLLERNGAFFYDLEINTNRTFIPVEIYCYNALREKAAIDFIIEVVDSQNDIWDIHYRRPYDEEDQPLTTDNSTDFVIATTKDTLSLRGKYFGLAGAQVGYEIYGYENQDTNADLILLTRDLFETTMDSGVYDLTELGSGYETGWFHKNDIELYPGRQRLIIYCENPGGLRVEYKDNGMHPDIMYNMPESDQEIIFDIDETDETVVNFVPITYKLSLNAYESAATPHVFTNEYVISGKVKTLYSLEELNIKSFTGGLTFENDTSEITVPVDAGNIFKVKIKVTMEKDDFKKDYIIAAFPTKALLAGLKRGARISVKKSYDNTDYIPDFSAIKQENWTAEQGETLIVPFAISFNRDDIPTPENTVGMGYIEARLIMNYDYQNEIRGRIEKIAGTHYYQLLDNSGDVITLTPDRLKEGINRIEWTLYFNEINAETGVTIPHRMSYSNSGLPGMEDYLFSYTIEKLADPTELYFSSDLNNSYYDKETLPEFNIKKDQRTVLTLLLNGQVIWEDKAEVSEKLDYALPTDQLTEGKNILKARYTEPEEPEAERSFTFMYDSKDPVVRIESYKFDSAYKLLTEITASVEEANYKEAYFHYGNTIVNQLPDVEIKSNDRYVLQWTNLKTNNVLTDIEPSSVNPVTVEARDMAGNGSFSPNKIEGYSDSDKPVETDIREQAIGLPIYDTNAGYPLVDNELNYTQRDFPAHTKFAPAKFLMETSIKEEMADGMLIKNNTTPLYWSKMESEDNIANNPEIRSDIAPFTDIQYSRHRPYDSGDNGTWESYIDHLPTEDFGSAYELYSRAIPRDSHDQRSYENGYRYILPYGGIERNWNKGTFEANVNLNTSVSYSMSRSCYNAAQIFFISPDPSGPLCVNVINEMRGKVYLRVYSENVLLSETDIGNKNEWKKIQVYWDRDNLYEDTTVVIKVDDATIVLEDSLPDMSKHTFNTKLDSYASGQSWWAVFIFQNYHFTYSWTRLDNFKVWDNTSLFDDNIENNYINRLNESNENKYLVVKIAKNSVSNKTLTKEDISNNNIIFQAIGRTNQGIDYIRTLTTTPVYIDGFNNLYLIQDTQELIDQFELNVGTLPEDPEDPGITRYPGSLKIKYDENWTNFSPADVYLIGKKDDAGNNYHSRKDIVLYDPLYRKPAGDISIDPTDDTAIDVHPQFLHEGNKYYEQPLSGSDTTMWHQFGFSTVLSEDYALIGANMYSAAYIYQNSDGIWTESQKLIADGGCYQDFFGYSMANSGDYAIIGAPKDDDNGAKSGSAYIFKNENGTWNQKAKLTAGDGAPNDWFGVSVEISGDYAIVGAYKNDEIDTDAGAVYVFKNNNDTWEQVDKLTAPDGPAEDYFGFALAISDTYLVVSAMGDNDKGISAGAVYIYENNDGVWEYDAKLTASDGTSYVWFGYDVSLSNECLLVSAYVDNATGVDSGSAYIFRNIDGLWQQEDKLIPGGSEAYDYIGTSVSLYDDIAVIGTRGDDDKGTDAGAAYVYRYNEGKWEEIDKLTADDGREQDWFGFSVSVHGDDILVGADRSDIKSTNSGAAYMYHYDYHDQRAFTHDNDSDTMSVAFWLRLEDEGLEEDIYKDTLKRIFTLVDREKNKEIMHLGYRGNFLDFCDESGPAPVSMLDSLLPLGTSGKNIWHLVVLEFDNINDTIDVYINSILYCTIDVFSDTLDPLLKKDALYYFGAKRDTEEFNTGFYSVSLPFYINRLLTEDEISRIYALRDKGCSRDQSIYDFNTIKAGFGDSNTDLHLIELNDYYSSTEDAYKDCYAPHENARYNEPWYYGSLKASSIHKNFLKTKDNGSNKAIVIFGDADECVSSNVEVRPETRFFTLTPGAGTGRYYFGDKTGNHGLGKDRWYSLSGEVLDIDSTTHARLIVRINGNEQAFNLVKGNFNYIFDNAADETPYDVKLYIETDGPVTISNHMMCNEGNYTLPATYATSAVKTVFPFDLSGTVHFWYKPFNANKDGFVNYETVLFDSEYIKIGTHIKTDERDAKFYAYLKNENGESIEVFTFNTEVKVTHNWQHIQLSYSTEQKTVFLYINGQVAGAREDITLPVYGSLTGHVPDDNVHIGCDEDELVYAEGYLDNVVISKYFLDCKYADNSPVTITYDKDNFKINLNQRPGYTLLTDIAYSLDALDSDFYDEGTEFPVDLLATAPGRYRLTTTMQVQGHNYQDILCFNIDKKPKFTLEDRTPIVFSSINADLSSDITLKFKYDDSYKITMNELLYSGLAVNFSYNNDVNHVIYLVQDFVYQDNTRWLIGKESTDVPGTMEWETIHLDNAGLLEVVCENIKPGTGIHCEIKYFYFINTFTQSNSFANTLPVDVRFDIPLASIKYDIKTYPVEEKDEFNEPYTKEYEYMLDVSLLDNTTDTQLNNKSIFDGITIGYEIYTTDDILVNQGETRVNTKGSALLFYDDILPGYKTYQCSLSLHYQGAEYARVTGIELNREKRKVSIDDPKVKILEIKEFSTLFVDKEKDLATLYLKYYANDIRDIQSKIDVIYGGKIFGTSIENPLPNIEDTYYPPGISIPKGHSIIKITLSAEGFVETREIEIINNLHAPEIVLTNWVESLISYNNVYFSWKGYYEGKYNEDIEYSYNFDDTGWSTPNNQWREVRYYDLAEGYHTFMVKARFNGIESSLRAVTFFVDISRPQFDRSHIFVENIYTSKGVLYAVNIRGEEGAINDASLTDLYVNNNNVSLGDEGSFYVKDVPVTKDGVNKILLTAVDKVNNFTDYNIEVDNNLTEIIFPDTSQPVKYCPMTIVGTINSNINAGMSIYVKDIQSVDKGNNDYTGWKKAKINADRTFFVEDIFVNPGTSARELLTTLKILSVFDRDDVTHEIYSFKNELNVYANEIIMPIEMTLNTHSAEGQTADTYIEINCKANVDHISSWSVDYDGDGIYDEIDLVKNPADMESQSHYWTHKYSTIGLINPRARVITTDGNYFSVTERIIIHEKITEASNKKILNPLSLSSVRVLPDNYNLIFVLTNNNSNSQVEVYKVGKNDAYISEKMFTIDLTSLGIVNPVKIKVLDKDHIFIGENVDGRSILYELTTNNYGNYQILGSTTLNYSIRDITMDHYNLFISYSENRSIAKIPLVNSLFDVNNILEVIPELFNTEPLGANTGIAKDIMGLLIADYYNQRIVRLTNSLKMAEQTGSLGVGEKEFIKPSIIKSYENRIFVYDEDRRDIQIFDQEFRSVCNLEYNSTNPEYHNYVEPDFFTEITDVDVITKIENNRLYYYALILSKSTGKLAMLKLPQWEELRARVRNNKVVFLRDGEVFTAKPDGGDLAKILSSDSIPRIEGALDYPALSPDGRTLVFTSRMKLYNGKLIEPVKSDIDYLYDKIYTYDIENKELTRIQLTSINGYELERPVFNSNGDRIIFSARSQDTRWQIYVYDFSTREISTLFSSDENARFPYYSPDDRFVVFTTDYDGSEEIEIIDTANTSMRVMVTKNTVRDSYPVWSAVYPYEIINTDAKIESKIAFVSERNFHKGVYYLYLSRRSEADIRIVTKEGNEVGNNPDNAAIELTTTETEGDYPCFTGDGRSVVYEYFNGTDEILKRHEFESGETGDMELPGSAKSPGGMKNMITNFTALNKDGDNIELKWNRYTDNDIYYFVQFKKNKAGEECTEKKVFSQNGTTLSGLEMGQEYLVRVCIIENGEEVATTLWKKVKMPVVVAIPSYTIDENNPYIVHLHAWMPEYIVNQADNSSNKWSFKWIINNTEINTSASTDYPYEFGLSGPKTIILKVEDQSGKNTSYSAPMEVTIKSDIEPVIEYAIAENGGSIELNALNSKGKKIDHSKTSWLISGPGAHQVQSLGGLTSVQLDGYQHKIIVTLSLTREAVSGLSDIIQKTMVIDLEYKEIKPIITMTTDENNKRFITFSGEYSLGNIDWTRARWNIYADGGLIAASNNGGSTFEYLFPPTLEEKSYIVTLTLPRRNDGMTQTVSQVVSVEESPIEPEINYEILTIKERGNIIGAKMLLDCTKSKGSEIDYTQARWNVAAASTYGEQSTQIGPTAIYTLVGATEELIIDVALTLIRKGSTEGKTVTKLISLNSEELPESKLVVSKELVDNATGKKLILDILKSTGPNIDWERTEWIIDNKPYEKKGPVATVDIPASGEKTVVNYVCTLYRTGITPQVENGQVPVDASAVKPLISYRRLSATRENVYELSVLDTQGVNIDWEKTLWYIYDGNEKVVVLQGAKTAHAFALVSEKLGYPVLVEMFLKGSSLPFVGYTTIDIEGDDLLPVITYDTEGEDPNIITFDASASKGGNIEWREAKWTFGDSGEAQYGATVVKKYPVDSLSRKYRVTLTLTRRAANGMTETKMVYRDITIGQDTIKPKVTAKVVDDTLFLSCQESGGRGLMLDRSVWMFPGEGDQYSSTDNLKDGVIQRDSTTINAHGSFEVGWQNQTKGDFFWKASVGGGVTWNWETTDYSDYKESNVSYSNQNSHTGTVCRRYVGGESKITVILFVYRVNKDGGMDGESVTVNIDLDEAKSGVTYE